MVGVEFKLEFICPQNSFHHTYWPMNIPPIEAKQAALYKLTWNHRTIVFPLTDEQCGSERFSVSSKVMCYKYNSNLVTPRLLLLAIDWISVPLSLSIHVLKTLHPPGGIKKWGHWEVISRSWKQHLMNGISTLIRETPESSLTLLSREGTRKRPLTIYEQETELHYVAQFWTPQAPELWGMNSVT